MTLSVAELYDKHPFDHGNKRWPLLSGIKESIVAAENLHNEERPLEYLDDVAVNDYNLAQKISAALVELPEEAMMDNFGEEVAVWATVNSTFGRDTERLQAALARKFGYDITDFDTSFSWLASRTPDVLTRDVLRQYEFIQDMRGGELGQIDLPKILTSCALNGIELSDKRLADYELSPLSLREYCAYDRGGKTREWYGFVSDTVEYKIWMDAPVGFTLQYKGAPNAMAGLALRGPDCLMIQQIQGVNGKEHKIIDNEHKKIPVRARGLMPLDWKRVIVEISEEIARTRNIGTVGILAAKNNRWTTVRYADTGKVHLPLATAESTYDSTARSHGYEPQEHDYGNWYKPLMSKAS